MKTIVCRAMIHNTRKCAVQITRELSMSRFSVAARLGTFAATGAVCTALAAGGVAAAGPAHITAKSAGCPATAKIAKAAGVKLNAPTVAKRKGVVLCSYLNSPNGVLVVVEPRLSGTVTPAFFNSDMEKAAKGYKSKIHKIKNAGKAAAYFDMHQKMLGHEDYFGGVDAPKHLIGLGDNQSPQHIIKLARALG
jgi:hypothetical protein